MGRATILRPRAGRIYRIARKVRHGVRPAVYIRKLPRNNDGLIFQNMALLTELNIAADNRKIWLWTIITLDRVEPQ